MKLWIARDDGDDTLWCYDKKPFVSGLAFACEEGSKVMFQLPKDLFSEVTFENSPQEVEISLVK